MVVSLALGLVACGEPSPGADALGTDIPTPDAAVTDTPVEIATVDVAMMDAQRVDLVTVDTLRPDVLTTDAARTDATRPDGTLSDAGMELVTDGGTATDAGCSESDRYSCVSGTPGGACGDALTVARCVSGAWSCAEGMIPVAMCACVGRPPGRDCVCVSTGWRCDVTDSGAPDAVVDAAPVCPADVATLLGTPCPREGQSCGGPCTDSCRFCNLVVCRSGRWSRVEVFPDPRCMDSGRD